MYYKMEGKMEPTQSMHECICVCVCVCAFIIIIAYQCMSIIYKSCSKQWSETLS